MTRSDPDVYELKKWAARHDAALRYIAVIVTLILIVQIYTLLKENR